MSDHRLHPSDIRPEQVHVSKSSGWRKLPAVGAVLGVVGLGAAFALKSGDESQFYFSYLTAYMTWLAVALGGYFFTVIQHASRAGWSVVVRRIAEATMAALPVMALLVIPVFMGVHDLFHWSHVEVVEGDPMLSWKAPFLNESGFYTRGAIYVAVWAVFGWLFYTWSTQQDEASDPAPLAHRMRALSPLAIVLFGLTLTFAAIDWIMSLDPHWYSTIFGVYYFAGIALCGHAFIALIAALLQRSGYLRGIVTIEHYHDLGKMMFGFTVFWAYIGFSQYMLYWYASIPEETYWYAYRGHGDWLALSLLLVFARFAVPFVLFMSRRWKRRVPSMVFWSVWMLVVQFVDMYWLVQPVLAHEHGSSEIHFGALDILTLVGIGGLFLAVFGWALVRRPLIPLRDPRLEESLNHENF